MSLVFAFYCYTHYQRHSSCQNSFIRDYAYYLRFDPPSISLSHRLYTWFNLFHPILPYAIEIPHIFSSKLSRPPFTYTVISNEHCIHRQLILLYFEILSEKKLVMLVRQLRRVKDAKSEACMCLCLPKPAFLCIVLRVKMNARPNEPVRKCEGGQLENVGTPCDSDDSKDTASTSHPLSLASDAAAAAAAAAAAEITSIHMILRRRYCTEQKHASPYHTYDMHTCKYSTTYSNKIARREAGLFRVQVVLRFK